MRYGDLFESDDLLAMTHEYLTGHGLTHREPHGAKDSWHQYTDDEGQRDHDKIGSGLEKMGWRWSSDGFYNPANNHHSLSLYRGDPERVWAMRGKLRS